MTDITTLLQHAIDKNPIEFADAFDSIVKQKAIDALAIRKIDLANAMYGGNTDDIDIDNINLDDLDLDNGTDQGGLNDD